MFVLVLIVAVSIFVGTSIKNTITPVGIVIHHSAVPVPINNSSALDAKAINEIHGKRGFGIFYWGQTYHIGYHYVILPDGTLQQGRPERCRGAHTTGHNDCLGICLIGDFSPTDNANGDKGPQQPTSQQMETLTNLVRHLRGEYNIPLTSIYTHHELNQESECPGENFPFNAFLNSVSLMWFNFSGYKTHA